MQWRCFLVVVILLASVPVLAGASPKSNPNQSIDRIIANERALSDTMRKYSPMVETYLQRMQPDTSLGFVPSEDHYFLGRVQFQQTKEEFYLDKRLVERMAGAFSKLYSLSPVGFSSMIFVDRTGFDRKNYRFHFMQREFLGEVRCLLFEVSPIKSQSNRFRGAIWVEDEGYNIVRFNGSYGTFHIDSWRMNLQEGVWLPAVVYSEEFDSNKPQTGGPRVKAQTRLWGYNLGPAGRESEFAEIVVDPEAAKDSSSHPDKSPLDIQRSWQRRAEDNVIIKLQELGLVVPEGEVDNVLQTVVTNLEVTNKIVLDPEVRCRVMPTTPIEVATIGHTILVSRGLLDALPNEAALAAVLAHALAHATLGHDLDSSFAFNDRLVVPSLKQLPLFDFKHNAEQESAADALGLKIVANSPYKDNLAEAGLFLKALAKYGRRVPNLIKANLGESLVTDDRISFMSALAGAAPPLELENPQQIVALPLGSRVKLDPWAGQLKFVKASPPRIYSAKDKLALEVTPFSPYLVRVNEARVNDVHLNDSSGTRDPASNSTQER
ncbi:MAG TPA: M48 family metalloprotease [Candidatus Dormibacteraeota bacterium]|nr:M48 family metalloprotease [Candidatus Dormibacteraeota bacterium]